MKRILALLIVITMLLAMLVSCSGDSDKSGGGKTTTSSSDTIPSAEGITVEVEPIDEDLAALDYNGDRIVTILARDSKPGAWSENEIYVDEITNDPVKDSVYNRNASVCEILGLKDIVQVSAVSGDADDLQQKVNVMVGSGDQTYDIVSASVFYGMPMVTQGLMYDLYDNGIDTYLDSSKPWWSQYWLEQAEMGDKLYCIT
ncbi:MAG: hypothetical protein IKU19_09570, partial [Clostridia bacterium]|nr:hypothetical protein [Clostridia bacterium]